MEILLVVKTFVQASKWCIMVSEEVIGKSVLQGFPFSTMNIICPCCAKGRARPYYEQYKALQKKKKKNQCTLSSLVCDLNWTCLYLLKITQGDTAQPWMHSSNCCGRKTSLSEVNKTMKISASILFFLAKTLYWHFWFGVELLMRLSCVSIDSLSNNNFFFFSFPFWHRPH